MPNGGITPDCVHCKLYKGKPRSEGEPFCTLHNISLPSPIRAFCAGFVDLEPVDDVDWLDQELDRSSLNEELMYVWLGGYEVKFFHVPLAPINDYGQWTQEKFLQELQRVRDEHENT